MLNASFMKHAIVLKQPSTFDGRFHRGGSTLGKINPFIRRTGCQFRQPTGQSPGRFGSEIIGDVNYLVQLLLEGGNDLGVIESQIEAKSAPENPGVPLAIVLKFTSGAIFIFFT